MVNSLVLRDLRNVAPGLAVPLHEVDADGVDYWTLEVVNGETSALRWQDSYGQALVEAALTHGGNDWRWVSRAWGVILELAFPDEEDWLRFRATPAVRAALDAVPDPVSGLLVYQGRGGSSAAGVSRRPRPAPMRDGVQLPEPDPEPEPPEPWLGPQHGRTPAG